MPYHETTLTRYYRYHGRCGSTFNFIIGLVCCLLVGVADLLTPHEYIFSFIYILPILFITWFAGKRAGFLVSLICTVFLSYHYHYSLSASLWNNLSMLGIFCVLTTKLFRIRQLLETESTLSRTDPLTGAMNLRSFSELVEYETMRLQREFNPFSIAYFDVDNLKQVNDQYGHRKGDELLKAVVKCLTQNLRRTDVVARIGGDEFTIFFPATDEKAVKVISQKVIKAINELSKRNNWPTTISMGVVTCTNGESKLSEMIANADKLMYEVKHSGKNDVIYAVYPLLDK
jgi:diguanylate cyclase (GGDEF)-like protein